MKKQVYIHIGIGKTGTSSIQRMMQYNAENLIKNGVLYPLAELHPSGAQHVLADFKNEYMSDKIQSLFTQIKREYIANDSRMMILSAEGFCFCKASYIDEIANIFREWDVKIIFYTRNQVDILKSSYLQGIKNNTTKHKTFEDYFKYCKNAFRYSQRIEGWINAFGKKSIILKDYDDEKVKKNLLYDFARTCDIESLIDFEQDYNENESIISEFIKVTRMINSIDMDVKSRTGLIKEIISLSTKFKKYSDKKHLLLDGGMN